MDKYFVYMLLCFDRRPVELVHCFGFSRDAISWEKQLKGWSRAKKRALIQNDWQRVHQIVCEERRTREGRKSTVLRLRVLRTLRSG